jgi:hypothetical protein
MFEPQTGYVTTPNGLVTPLTTTRGDQCSLSLICCCLLEDFSAWRKMRRYSLGSFRPQVNHVLNRGNWNGPFGIFRPEAMVMT